MKTLLIIAIKNPSEFFFPPKNFPRVYRHKERDETLNDSGEDEAAINNGEALT
jgi:hypothetical protein